MIQIISLVLLLLIILISFKYSKKRRRMVELIEKIPGPKCYPIIGSFIEFLFVPRNGHLNLTLMMHKRFGPVYKVWLGPSPSVHITRPEDLEVILSSRKNINKAFGYNFFEPWLGTGLLTSSGTKWATRRKMLTPSFHFSILQSFFDVFVENAYVFVNKLEKEVKSEEFNVFPYIKNCTLDIICETAMGVKINAQEKPSEYTESVKVINELIHQRIYRPWLWPHLFHSFTEHYRKQNKALRVLHGMSLNVIRERKRQRLNEKNVGREDQGGDVNTGRKNKKMFLDLLLDISDENGQMLTEADIREEVDTFMFEGHDTTSVAVGWTIYLLGRHPEIQDKVLEELDSIFGSSDRPPTIKDIAELKYLECVIKESLRLFPSVPVIARTLIEDVRLGGYLVPSGTTIRMNIYQMHRQPDHFPNPEKFDPSNFFPEKAQKRHPFAYIPFSAGSRNCIGQKFAMLEEKVILSIFFRKYRVVSHEKYEDLKLIIESIIHPENGVLIKINKRRP